MFLEITDSLEETYNFTHFDDLKSTLLSIMKLYAVTISYKAYVLAENEESIEDHIREIKRWENHEVEFYETTTNGLGWTAECLVYHEGADDITIRQALNIVNNKEEKTDV